jgi:hypothetical protein
VASFFDYDDRYAQQLPTRPNAHRTTITDSRNPYQHSNTAADRYTGPMPTTTTI